MVNDVARSNSGNPVEISQNQSRDSQESEQIKSGPLCGLLIPREKSNQVKPSQIRLKHSDEIFVSTCTSI
jgi:hypothetical protein